MNLGVVLRAPVSRRTWSEIVYVVPSAPLAGLGFVYGLVTLALGTGLAVTAAGFPLLAAGLLGARQISGLHRWLAGRLLGERIEPPPRRVAPQGLLSRLQSRLCDAAGWRAMGFLLMKFPLAVVELYVLVLTCAWGGRRHLPLQRALGVNPVSDPEMFGVDVSHGTFAVFLCVAGVVVLFLAPWAVHVATYPERVLMRWLLGRRGLAERVRDLEETRACAVDDAAATVASSPSFATSAPKKSRA